MRLMVFQDSQILQLGFLYNLILLTSGRKPTEGEKKDVSVFSPNCWNFRNRSFIKVSPWEQQIKKSFLVPFQLAVLTGYLSPLVFPAQVADNTMDGGPIFLIFSPPSSH